jgi:hypothetical protein
LDEVAEILPKRFELEELAVAHIKINAADLLAMIT